MSEEKKDGKIRVHYYDVAIASGLDKAQANKYADAMLLDPKPDINHLRVINKKDYGNIQNAL